MLKRTITTCLITILSLSSNFAQNPLRNGEVMGNIRIGNQEVTSVLDETTGCIHKTDLHARGMFVDHERVQLRLNERNGRQEIIKPELPEQVFANKGCQNSGNNYGLTKNLKDLKIASNRKIIADLSTYDVHKNGEFLEFGCLEEARHFVIALDKGTSNWVNELPESEDDFVIPNELLDLVESSFAHDSYRKMVENNYINILRNSSGLELEELANPNPSNALTDESQMSIFNDKSELMIAGAIFKYVDDENIALIKNADYNILGEIRGGANPRGLEKVEMLHFPNRNVVDHEEVEPSNIIQGICGNKICEKWACETISNCTDCKNNTTGGTTGTCVPKIEVLGLIQDDCNPLDISFTLTIKNSEDYEDNNAYNDRYRAVINFDDGTPVEEPILYSSNQSGVIHYVTHTYTSLATYKIAIDVYNETRNFVTDDCDLLGGGATIVMQDIQAACEKGSFFNDGAHDHYYYHLPGSGGKKAIKYWVHQLDNLVTSSLSAKSKYMERKSTSKPWREKNVGKGNYIGSSFSGDYYNDNCSVKKTSNKSKSTHRYHSAKSVDYSPNQGFGTRPNDITSSHWVVIDGVRYPSTTSPVTSALNVDPC